VTSSGLRVAVVGATGAVGRELLTILEERRFPAASVRAFASERSAGEFVSFGGEDIAVEALDARNRDESFDLALFSAGSELSLKHAPEFAAAGAWVVDNSSAFRGDEGCPLVVPEINSHRLREATKQIVANPNCTTIALVQTLFPLAQLQRVKRVVVSTYQSVSGAGQAGMDELESQVRNLLNGIPPDIKTFSERIAFNCLPLIGAPDQDGVTEEERKIVRETRRILSDERIAISATAVRVPVFIGHSLSVNVEFEGDLDPEAAAQAMADHAGVLVTDRESHLATPTTADIAGEDMVLVGRLRRDRSVEHGLAYWVVSDNLRKGAALNAVQIAESLIQRDLMGATSLDAVRGNA
jgi:aspartate-semialdehyde dehydrogenase